MPRLQTSISTIVEAAIDTGRTIELDAFIVRVILERDRAPSRPSGRTTGRPPLHLAINFTPASLLDPQFEASAFAKMVEEAGPRPQPDHPRVHGAAGGLRRRAADKQVKALRRLGFGFAIDDAGAGLRELHPHRRAPAVVIKIDREIAYGIARDDAKQALVEAFVSFGGRIGALLLAEGIETREPTSRC